MSAYHEPTRCESCGQIIPAQEDVIEYKYKLYCPTCYTKKLSGGTSPVGILVAILSIMILVMVIISWLIW